MAANPRSVPKASRLPSGAPGQRRDRAAAGPAIGRMRSLAMSASTTRPSVKPAATMSCCGWQATRVQSTPSPPASSVGALPIGPPPKNGHSTTLSAPEVASHLPCG